MKALAKIRVTLAALALASLLCFMTGCKKNESTAGGALLGGASGAAIGGAAGGGHGAAIGAVVGAASGALIGNAVGDEEVEKK